MVDVLIIPELCPSWFAWRLREHLSFCCSFWYFKLSEKRTLQWAVSDWDFFQLLLVFLHVEGREENFDQSGLVRLQWWAGRLVRPGRDWIVRDCSSLCTLTSKRECLEAIVENYRRSQQLPVILNLSILVLTQFRGIFHATKSPVLHLIRMGIWIKLI